MNLNQKQLIVLWAAIGVIVIMCMFPPWRFYIQVNGGRTTDPGPYRLVLLGEPRSKAFFSKDGDLWGAGIDIPRLFLPCFGVVLIAAGLIFTFGNRKKPLIETGGKNG